MSKKRILVTGAAGFMGSHLADYLTKEGHQVYGIDDYSGGYEQNTVVPTYKCDLRDKEALAGWMKEIRPEVIYHLAADATEGRSQFTPINCVTRNYNTTLNLVVEGLKHGMERFVFTSSMAVYGEQDPPFTEVMDPKPEDVYGISKYAAEESLRILAEVHGFEHVIVRPHNVYGPRQNMADPYRNVVAIFLNKILKGEPLIIYGDGEQTRAFTYIADITPLIAECGLREGMNGKVFNLGSDVPYSINDLVGALEEVCKESISVVHEDFRPREVKHAFSTHDVALEEFGDLWQETPLERGLRDTFEWANGQGSCDPVYMDMEIDSDVLPAAWRDKKI